ncbi:hypothetical protein KBY66_13925 [Synechococcus sp. Tobar12-5m-g]|nr:hypothetical protein [Synechococcus sp. Cruz CV-v-12]MCP9773696.1 hypothetical protein [Synechococcus sp. Tobar12-5m-g]MCP9874692.1 hypothetical protein [Synechococcus sp. Cruz CV-v-12]
MRVSLAWMLPIGEQNVNALLKAFWNVVKSDGAGDWTLRAKFQFLFPR